MIFSGIFFIASDGTCVISKIFPGHVLHSTIDQILEEIMKQKVQPYQMVNQFHVYAMCRDDIYYVGICETSEQKLEVLDILLRVFQVCKDFCGDLQVDSVERNWILIHEILDEMFCDGVLVNGDTNKLKGFVHSEPVRVTQSVELSSGLFGKERRTASGTSAARSVLSTRPQQDDRKNELFIDIVEMITAVFDANNVPTRCQIQGQVCLKSFVHGNPALRVTLNEVASTPECEEQLTGYGRQIYLSGCKFHSNVSSEELFTTQTLSVQPTDGEMSLMTYSVCGDSVRSLPLHLYKSIQIPAPGHDIDLTVKVCCDVQTLNCKALNLAVTIPVPHTTTRVSQHLGSHTQSAAFCEETKILTWKVEEVMARAEVSASFKLIGANLHPASVPLELGPAELDFEFSGYLCSNLKIKSIKTRFGHDNVDFAKWIRYISKPSTYTFKFH